MMRKRTTDVEAPENTDECDDVARLSEEFFDARESNTVSGGEEEDLLRPLGRAPPPPARRRSTARAVVAYAGGALAEIGRAVLRGPSAVAGDFARSAEVRECVAFLAKTTSTLKADARDMYDAAKAATADTAVGKLDAWLARQRRFQCEDPSMPSWAIRVVPPVFDVVAAEARCIFEGLVEEELKLRARRTSEVDHEPERDARGLRVVARLRARLLYALLPYDRSPWERSRSPVFWIVRVLCACPYFGVQSATFFAILLAIDRRDTFQLVEFLLSFKQYQFWVNGLVALVSAAARLHWCVAVVRPGDAGDCGRAGAREMALTVLGRRHVFGFYVFGWLSQLLFGWVALFLLRAAVSKGGAVRRGHRLVGEKVLWEEGESTVVARVVAYDRRTDEHEVARLRSDGDEARAPRAPPRAVRLHEKRYFVLGHRLPMRVLLFWDAGCFLVTAAAAFAFVAAASARGSLDPGGWQIRAALKGARIGYSLTAFPFFMVSLPIYKTIFATAKQTGYTRDGVCVPVKNVRDYGWVK